MHSITAQVGCLWGPKVDFSQKACGLTVFCGVSLDVTRRLTPRNHKNNTLENDHEYRTPHNNRFGPCRDQHALSRDVAA